MIESATRRDSSGSTVTVVGGGLAGTEAALFLAGRGVAVTLYEMRPERMTPAHATGNLAELVCSNSLRSDDLSTAAGLLKEEMRRLGSAVLAAADRNRVPAGTALAVDREAFSRDLTRAVEEHPLIRVVRHEVTELPSALPSTILAPGPLVSDALAACIAELAGHESFFFFDAIAPIVSADSLDMTRIFRGSRYGAEEGGDYLNAPMDRETYERFVRELLAAEQFVPHGFEAGQPLPLFPGCQPIEAIASTGLQSLAHGPMRPTGFAGNPLGDRLHALVQLRAENESGTAYNLVGFQTRLKQGEQKRVFRMIPGLENAEILRYGSLHRNSFIDSPRVLSGDLSFRKRPDLFAAGQFAGAEGYVESTALGLLAAIFVHARLEGRAAPLPPDTTAIGALLRYVTTCPTSPLEPSNIHFGLLPPGRGQGRQGKRQAVVIRAREALSAWLDGLPGK
jgi:methylenetetrahydrofolate--tRNA-(uracil-5-)-methyltransferase